MSKIIEVRRNAPLCTSQRTVGFYGTSTETSSPEHLYRLQIYYGLSFSAIVFTLAALCSRETVPLLRSLRTASTN
jgi:hypothetical protein